jgi:hypothetical protein
LTPGISIFRAKPEKRQPKIFASHTSDAEAAQTATVPEQEAIPKCQIETMPDRSDPPGKLEINTPSNC